jgi:D-alanyl-D-alanine endopeptidase (penicillin-binding protein 7)
LLQLALMSSENRAANALARTYPGGLSAFVAAANHKAAEIGMRDSVFMDGTGLSASNVSTARDLAVMVAEASRYALIRKFSTEDELTVKTAHGARRYGTTNRLVRSPEWDIALQKTGYINESGNCLVMRGRIDGRSLILVLLDSHGRYSRLGDAQRLRRWLEG